MTAIDDQDLGPEEEVREHPRQSFMVADLGQSRVVVTLYDLVEGAYRLVAQGQAANTAGPPRFDLVRGLQQALQQITTVTGRALLTEQGYLIRPARGDGAGVDQFLAVISAADPFKTIVVGLSDDVSVASARRALRTVYAREVDRFGLSDTRRQREQIEALIKQPCDLLLVSGGTDGGADRRLLKLVETLSYGLELIEEDARPSAVFAGNVEVQEEVKQQLGQLVQLETAANVRPTVDSEQLDDLIDLLRELYISEQVRTMPGGDEVLNWITYPALPTAHAFGGICEYYAALSEGPVLGVDVGGGSVSLISARPNEVEVLVRTDLGVGRPMAGMGSQLSSKNGLSWIDESLTPADVLDYVYDKSFHPNGVPLTESDLQIEQAMVRQMLAQMAKQMTDILASGKGDSLALCRVLLVRGGGLLNTPRMGKTLLMVLDSLQPVGTFEVVADPLGVLPAMGVLAPHNPELVVQVLNSNVVQRLGWVVAPSGEAQAGQLALKVKLVLPDKERLDAEVAFGTIETLPLMAGQRATVTLQPVSQLDIGAGPGQSRKLTIEGGQMGLIVDARGRPVIRAGSLEERRRQVARWLLSIGG